MSVRACVYSATVRSPIASQLSTRSNRAFTRLPCGVEIRRAHVDENAGEVAGVAGRPSRPGVARDRAEGRDVGDDRHDAGRHRLDQRVAAAFVVAAADEHIGGRVVVRQLVAVEAPDERDPVEQQLRSRARARRRFRSTCRRQTPSARARPGNCGSARSSPSSTVSGSLLVVSLPTHRINGDPVHADGGARALPAHRSHRRARFDDLDHALIGEHAGGPPRLSLFGCRE